MIITPDISADTCEGATGWARGSQTWSGIAPAFVPKPTTTRMKTRSRAIGGSPAAAAPKPPKPDDPAEDARIAKATTMAAVARCVMAR